VSASGTSDEPRVSRVTVSVPSSARRSSKDRRGNGCLLNRRRHIGTQDGDGCLLWDGDKRMPNPSQESGEPMNDDEWWYSLTDEEAEEIAAFDLDPDA
jgi:hypothetical protein